MKSKPLRKLLELLFIAGRNYQESFAKNFPKTADYFWNQKEQIIKEIESRSKTN